MNVIPVNSSVSLKITPRNYTDSIFFLQMRHEQTQEVTTIVPDSFTESGTYLTLDFTYADLEEGFIYRVEVFEGIPSAPVKMLYRGLILATDQDPVIYSLYNNEVNTPSDPDYITIP